MIKYIDYLRRSAQNDQINNTKSLFEVLTGVIRYLIDFDSFRAMQALSTIRTIRINRFLSVMFGQITAVIKRLRARYFDEYVRQIGEKIRTQVRRVSSQKIKGRRRPRSERKAENGLCLSSGTAIGFVQMNYSSDFISQISIIFSQNYHSKPNTLKQIFRNF